MRIKLIGLALLPLLSACDLEIFGPGDWDLDWGGGGAYNFPTPAMQLSGIVRVGGYTADYGEATVYFYEPSDTLVPVDSALTDPDGRYARSWWEGDPIPPVCDWLAVAVLWSGEMGALEPIFGDDSPPCDLEGAYLTGDTLVVEYEPLEAPFALEGMVLSDDAPAQLEVTVPTRMPDPYAIPVMMTTTSDDEGAYRFESTDARQRFTWCRWVYAIVAAPNGVQERVDLWEVYDMTNCTEGRSLPDVRLGTDKAITGHLQVEFGPDVYRPATAGEASVALLEPADSSVVLGPVETLDDGSFHMWWPAEVSRLGFPGCDFLLRVELVDERSVVVPMLAQSQRCDAGVERWVTVP